MFGLFNKQRKIALETDWGRRYGWYIELNGQRVGELDYVRFDFNSQFWHEYTIRWYNPEDPDIPHDFWDMSGYVLRNRHYTDEVADRFIISPYEGHNIVAVRAAYVPEERL